MSATVRQLPLELAHRTAYGRDDFLVAPGNQEAVGWIDRWPAWSGRILVVWGPASSGKTHLADVWKQKSQAVDVFPEDVVNGSAEEIAGRGQNFVLHRADLLIGDREVETTFFHLYNLIRERDDFFLLTTQQAPAQLTFSLPDLGSRLRSVPAIELRAPDDELLAVILVKLFNDRQIQVTQEMILYLLPRMDRSFAAASDIVKRVDLLALAEKKPVSIPLLRRVLADLIPGHD